MAGFSITGKVEGLAEIVATLKDLPEKLQRKVVRKALAKATKPTLAAARQRCPKDAGLLKKSLGRKTVTYVESGSIVAIIGPRGGFERMVTRRGRSKPEKANPLYYAHLVEFGTKPHSLARADTKIGRRIANDMKIRMHPGTKARPFMRPAFDSTKGEVLRIFGEEVAKGLEQEMAKLDR